MNFKSRKWYHFKFILLQVFAAYYIIFFSINFFQIGIPTTAYFSDEYKAKVTLVGPPPEQDKSEWGKSSLDYVKNSTTLECSILSASFKNGIDSEAMLTNLRYGIFRDINGNNDPSVFIGEVNKKLRKGESYTISHDISGFGPGNYVMKVFQEEGHPGKSTPTADSVNYNGKCISTQSVQKEELQQNETPQQQTDTPPQSESGTTTKSSNESSSTKEDSNAPVNNTVEDNGTGQVEDSKIGNEEITNESSQDN